VKRLLLLGGGHAHLYVLQALARQRLSVAEVMLVSPHPALLYSGMVPGLVAGHYTAAQASIALAPWAAAAGAFFVEAAAVALDTAGRTVRLSDGRVAEYDVLSIDTGGVQRRDSLPGARERGLFVRPVEAFAGLQDALVNLAAGRVLDVVVIGAGAAGFELALALQHRLCRDGEERARVALVTGGSEPLAGYPPAAMAVGLRELARRRVTVFRERAAAIEAHAVVLASGARLACDAPVIATGAEAPPWLDGSGLALCERGFVRTTATLQSVSHPEVFAAGDVATREGGALPKSGVYAVRAGAPLALNLQRQLGGGPLIPWRPPARTLNLLSCGGRRAIAVWGGAALHGRWPWWWKDRIDRTFVARFAAPAPEAAATARAA
jgi:pyridine nucleotide-disulfide oxidoreductase family protein